MVRISNSTMTVKLSGDYVLNGSSLTSGTSLNFSITNGNVFVNGKSYSSIALTPKSDSNLLIISNGTETNNYAGSITFQVTNGKILPIDSVSMENYLKGVVGHEMSDYFPIESLKAQAVAARTYALKHEAACAAQGYDFDDTPNYQVYYGYSATDTNVNQAVDLTKGQVLTHNQILSLYYNGAQIQNLIPASKVNAFTENLTSSLIGQKTISFSATAKNGTVLGYLYKY